MQIAVGLHDLKSLEKSLDKLVKKQGRDNSPQTGHDVPQSVAFVGDNWWE